MARFKERIYAFVVEVEDISKLKPLIAAPVAFEMGSGFCVCLN